MNIYFFSFFFIFFLLTYFLEILPLENHLRDHNILQFLDYEPTKVETVLNPASH